MQSHYVHIYRQVCKSFKSSLLGRHQKSEDLFLEEHDPQADPNAMQVIQLEQRWGKPPCAEFQTVRLVLTNLEPPNGRAVTKQRAMCLLQNSCLNGANAN